MVTWHDASFDLEGPLVIEEFPVVTVGFEVGRSARFVTIAAEQVPDGFRALTYIPATCIEEIVELERSQL